jgi:carbamoyl-phosphate synthase large subunit
MREQTIAMAKAFNVVGLINVQFAIKNGVVYVLEVNPRASRTIPFVSKAIGVPLASHAARVMCGETLEQIGFTEEVMPPFVSKAIGVPLASHAARVMVGETLEQIGFTEEVMPPFVSVKEAVFPFSKFAGTDPVLGPEMRSTGEVMGISDSFGSAFAKAQLAASNGLPLSGAILITVNDSDKESVTPIARRFQEMGFRLFATRGTASYLRARGIPVSSVFKVHEGRPNCLDMIVNGDVQLLVNTPLGKHAQWDDYTLRQAAIRQRIAYTTTLSAASAACDAILSLKSRRQHVKSLQEWQVDVRSRVAESTRGRE